MLKKFFKYNLILIIVALFMIVHNKDSFADNDSRIKKSRISNRNKFTEQTKIRKDRLNNGTNDNDKSPPEPGDGGDGWPVPISDGLEFILIGGIIYFFLKRKKTRINS